MFVDFISKITVLIESVGQIPYPFCQCTLLKRKTKRWVTTVNTLLSRQELTEPILTKMQSQVREFWKTLSHIWLNKLRIEHSLLQCFCIEPVYQDVTLAEHYILQKCKWSQAEWAFSFCCFLVSQPFLPIDYPCKSFFRFRQNSAKEIDIMVFV